MNPLDPPAARGPEHGDMRKMQVSARVMEEWFVRDAEGHRVRIDWGQPDEEGFYNPTFTIDYTDTLEAKS